MAETLGLLLYGFAGVFSFDNILACLGGVFIGILIGAMPGIGPTTGLAVLLPLTYVMNPTTAVIMLASLYYATMYGGAITSVLINIPGGGPNVMTALEGYPFTQRGEAGKALTICFISSFIGGSIGMITLTLGGPALSNLGLRMGPPELALLIIFALTSIGWLLGDDIPSGLLATGLGILLATVGLDQGAGLLRFHFRQPNLMSGIDIVPLVIGVYGFAQVIELVVEGDRGKKEY